MSNVKLLTWIIYEDPVVIKESPTKHKLDTHYSSFLTSAGFPHRRDSTVRGGSNKMKPRSMTIGRNQDNDEVIVMEAMT